MSRPSYPAADRPWSAEMKARALRELDGLRSQLDGLRSQLDRSLNAGRKVVAVAEQRGRKLEVIAAIATHPGDIEATYGPADGEAQR